MITLPVEEIDGCLRVAEPVPENAISTALSKEGCEVYLPGDEEALAIRLTSFESPLIGE